MVKCSPIASRTHQFLSSPEIVIILIIFSLPLSVNFQQVIFSDIIFLGILLLNLLLTILHRLLYKNIQ